MATSFLALLGVIAAIMFAGCAAMPPGEGAAPANARRPAGDDELQYWLQNMVWYHGFTNEEIAAATGLADRETAASLRRFNITPQTRPPRPADAPLLVLPYPGGRHPRIGFLDGAIEPQRETKISVFAPWDDRSYAVVDVPEAIWSNLGLTYLAHTHIPTIWTEQNVKLEKLEWNRRPDGSLDFERKLPNGITFGTKVQPQRDAVHMVMHLTNGTDQTLTHLRVQVCVMLKGMKGFTKPTDDDKVFSKPYAACRSADGNRWIITAWQPCERLWLNPPVPCLHSDPQFPDCPPGRTRRIHGLLSFYEGPDVKAEFHRLDTTAWRASQD